MSKFNSKVAVITGGSTGADLVADGGLIQV